MSLRTLEHGRFLEDFTVGDVYAHPWEITVDEGMRALFAASFLDATPTYASASFARALGFRAQPVHPLLLLNLALSMSVHDVSERAVAHLAYLDVRFPEACFPGETVVATSLVRGVSTPTPSPTGARGVVHVRTKLATTHRRLVCTFERKALVRARASSSSGSRRMGEQGTFDLPASIETMPAELRRNPPPPTRTHRFEPLDFAPGDILLHAPGRTITESEHVALACLTRNTHPLHIDERWCKSGGSFTGTRVVYGGLVFAWIAALASRDVSSSALWDLAFDAGSHPAPVAAGDTLYAATRIASVEPHDARTSRVSMRLVGTKNRTPRELIDAGNDIFTFERDKPEDARVPEKVFEIDRTLLVATNV